MTRPSTSDLFRVLDETWPPARFVNAPPWTLREGAGGGQRVSAATLAQPVFNATDITSAEAGMRDLAQHPLFMLRPGEDSLNQILAKRGYEVVDPVSIYLKQTSESLQASVRAVWPPTSSICSLWEKGGIGPRRIDVMARAKGAKAALVSKDGHGVAFVAVSGSIAMLHALEVSPDARRRGIGIMVMQAASNWAYANGAGWLSLMVTRANTAANALYSGLGMEAVGQYHYRRAPQAKP